MKDLIFPEEPETFAIFLYLQAHHTSLGETLHKNIL